MNDTHNFTEGPILTKLIRFSGPVLLAMLLQATYGAVDLLVVGQFASSADVSAVATGSNIMLTLTGPLSSFAMGITVLLGQEIGKGNGKRSGRTIGAGIFRGIGDSKTPLIAVMIACLFNVAGDLFLVPSSFMQSMAAFTAQNIGAGKTKRALRAVYYGIAASLMAGAVIGAFTFFRGDLLCGIFSKDPLVIAAGADYLKSYAIDCLLTAVFFVFIGYYNGMGLTSFVMLQGIVSAFGVRVPVSYLMSKRVPVSLFHIGLATPCSSLLQIILCLGCLAYLKKKKDYRVSEIKTPGPQA